MKSSRIKVSLCMLAAIIVYCYTAIWTYYIPQGHGRRVHSTDNSSTADLGPTCYVTAKQKGRLGNQIFQYAALYALARNYSDCRAFLGPDFVNLTSTFALSIPVRDDVTFDSEKRVWDVEDDVDATLERLRPESIPRGRNVTVKGFFLSFRYFHAFKEEFRRELKFRDGIRADAERFLRDNVPASLSGTDFVRVGIHVRRTDRNTPFMTRLGYIRPGAEYYRRAMEYFRERYPRVLYVVASDDITWCRQHFSRQPAPVVFSRETFGVDLAILAACDHVITSVGTFGWWAGYLNPGTTVYNGLFPPTGTKAAVLHRPDNWYPPDDAHNHWVAITA